MIKRFTCVLPCTNTALLDESRVALPFICDECKLEAMPPIPPDPLFGDGTLQKPTDWSGDNMDLSKGGVKYDDGKPRFDLIAPEFEGGLAGILGYGARKYADRNWEKGMRWGRCVAAFRRHFNAWMSGEDIDPESGLHHLDHAACCLMFLRAYVARKIGEDDRKRIFE